MLSVLTMFYSRFRENNQSGSIVVEKSLKQLGIAADVAIYDVAMDDVAMKNFTGK